MKVLYPKVSKSTPCPICGKTDGCMISPDGEVVACLRIRDGSFKAIRDGMGWLHRMKGGRTINTSHLKPADDVPKKSTAEWRVQIKQFRISPTSPRMKREAEKLGVSVRSLERLQIGYDSTTNAFTFPMVNGELKPIGIRYRTTSGEKWCVPGSRNGLFIPEDYDPAEVPVLSGPHPTGIEPSTLLLAPEGPTDVAALLTLGLRGAGRPSNTAGVDMMIRLFKSGAKQDVVILADRDETKFHPDGVPFWPGIEGALSTASKLLESRSTARLRVCYPPGEFKDVRAWLRATQGPMAAMLHVIESASPVGHKWLYREQCAIDRRKREERRAAA